MRRWIRAGLITLLVVALVAVTIAVAQGPKRGREGKLGPKAPKGHPREAWVGPLLWGGELAEKLNLSEEQKSALKAIRKETQTKIEELNAELRKAHKELGELLKKSEASESEIYRKVDEIGGLQKKMLEVRIESLLKSRKVLTPEQREKLKEMWQERGKKFKRLQEKESE